MKTLITGATGFVGKELVVELLRRKNQVNAIVRKSSKLLPAEINQFVVADFGDLSSETTLKTIKESFLGVETIIHLAARVHVMQDDVDDPLAGFRKVNRDATLVLARLAVETGVKRFVLVKQVLFCKFVNLFHLL